MYECPIVIRVFRYFVDVFDLGPLARRISHAVGISVGIPNRNVLADVELGNELAAVPLEDTGSCSTHVIESLLDIELKTGRSKPDSRLAFQGDGCSLSTLSVNFSRTFSILGAACIVQ